MKVDFEGSGPAYKSYMGAAVYYIFWCMLVLFFFSKLSILINDGQITVTTNVIEGGIDQDYTFSNTDGLFIAAGLFESGSGPDVLDDDRYGSLIF